MEKTTLSKGLLLLMAFAVCATVPNLYYNQPLLPSIGASLNIHDGTLGLIPFASQIGYAVAILLISPLGDVMERRKLIDCLSILLFLALITTFFAHTIWLMVIAIFFIGIGANITQQIIPFASMLAGPKRKGRVISTIMTGLTIGILLSRTIAGIIAEHFGWRNVFLMAAILAVIIGILLHIFLPKTKANVSLKYPQLLMSMITLIRTQPLLRESALTGALWFAAFNALWATLAIHVTKSPFNYSVEQAGFFGFVGMAGIIGAKVSGRLADKTGPTKIITAGLLFVIAGFMVMLFFGDTLTGLIIGILLLDIGVFGSQIPNQVRVFSIDPNAQSRMNAVYMLCYYIGASLGSVIGVKIMGEMGWLGLTVFTLFLTVTALLYHVIKNARKMPI